MKLIFVYNAHSNPIEKLIDGVHKIVSPDTYDCTLCAVTFGAFTEDSLWKSYRETSGFEMQFYYKNEFQKQFRSKWLPKYDFPVVLIEFEQSLEIFISADELKEVKDSEELIELITARSTHYL